MEEQEQLIAIYKRLQELRRKGVRMKDIATGIDLSPSVLSALYASVLPVFVASVEHVGFDQALADGLAHVNNLSRKRLMELLNSMYHNLMKFHVPDSTHGRQPQSFLKSLEKLSATSANKLSGLEGMYMSYSCSSSLRTLKAEPFYFSVSGESGCFAVGRKSVHGAIREGIGIVQERQIIYLLLNAFQDPDFSLVSVYLQLPFLERIQYLRGLYLVPDYNQNPIARRIVLVKQAEHYNPEAFAQLEARLIPQNEFNTKEQLLYNYTCGDSDSIKMCTLPSPKLDLRDLQGEKDLLDLYASTNEKNANE